MRSRKPISDTQENVRHFNEGEAVWRRFDRSAGFETLSQRSQEEVLDEIDLREAERECRIRVSPSVD